MRYSRTILVFLFLLFRYFGESQTDIGLVGDYNFTNGTFINAVSKEKIKAYSVMLVDDRFNNPKSACFFQGTEGSYINLGNSAQIRPESGTISLWLNIERAALSGTGFQSNPVIFTKNLQKEDFFEAFSLSYNYDEQRICASTSLSEEKQVHVRASDVLRLGEWHHYAFSFDNTFLRLYVDGKLEGEVKKNFTTIYSPLDSVLLGSTASQKNNRFLLGSVDDVRIYNRVLNPAEILELYRQPDPNRFHQILKWVYSILIIIIVTAIMVWIMSKRAKKKLQLQEENNKILARMNELETRAIRMHMNPHFIFNSLNSLQRYILEADVEKAQNYLSRFSVLLRKILESSNSEHISLDQEIEILSTYIEIEKDRFENSFNFHIESSVPEPKGINIPFMLIQPLVENAIWHGLLPKKGDKKLRISFSKNGINTLLCQIEDNGVGIGISQNSGANNKKSQGLNFVRQRLEILQKINGIVCGIEFKNLLDEQQQCVGTSVLITIPIIN